MAIQRTLLLLSERNVITKMSWDGVATEEKEREESTTQPRYVLQAL